jgi:hypothetical protein
MWATLLVMAVAVSFEPIRIGLTVMMLARTRPMLQLLAFLCGGFAMGMSVGLLVLFVFRDTVSGATNFTLPKVQIIIGVLALLAAIVIAANITAGWFRRGTLTEVSTRARKLLQGRSLWVAGVVGSGIALPSVDYLAALAVILASGATPATQTWALLVFNVVALALVEIPLIGFLMAPDRTRAMMAGLHDWIRSRPRRHVALLLGAAGCVMLAVGMAGV